MAKTCSMCKKNMGMFEESWSLAPDKCKEIICYDCWNALSKLRTSKIFEEMKEADEYIKSVIANSSVSPIVREYLQEEIRQKQPELDRKYAAEEIRQADIKNRNERLEVFCSNTLITTSNCFDGFEIIKYCGLVSGEVVLGMGLFADYSANYADFYGEEATSFSEKMRLAKDAAKQQLIDQAIDCGGNAIIGVSFDYVTFSNNLLGVSVNGTAVVVKNKSQV